MKTVKLICGACGKEYEKSTGHYNRAIKVGYKMFCSHACSFEHRKVERTNEEKKALKSEYDKKRRNGPIREVILKKKKEYYVSHRDPVKEAQYRKEKRMPYHVEYCRKPEYRTKKKVYDQQYKNQKEYGEYAECAILAEKIKKTIIGMADKANLRTIQGTNNKSKKRKKQWLKLLTILPQLT